ncbi:MAG TPA: NAD(P)/FAD-dependent oxidoreductase [Gammaproteobacteria bacterium]|nr:NAD(P)/FAD-dependent oxidoreductase [Gammaproteobacteria bacterium]
MTRSSNHDVVVIGAGLAGLAAALKLEAAGLDVLVLEAQQRVGGRVYSMQHLGSNAEAGGTYIGAGYTRVIGAAEKHGVNLIDVTRALEFFREQDLALGEEIIRQQDWATHPANAFPEPDKAHLPWTYHRVLAARHDPLRAPEQWLDPESGPLDVSVHDWLAGIGLSERAIELAYGINASFGADAHDVSALLLFFRAAFSKVQRRLAPADSIGFTAERGVQRIPEAMAAALRREVALGRAAAAIEAGASGASGADAASTAVVRTQDGARHTARHVVCSLPFGVLRRIAIDPPLEGLQADAVASLPAQPITQFYLRPTSRFWEEDGYAPSLFTDSAAGMIGAVRGGADPAEITTLTAWVMGRNAARLDALAPAAAGREVIAAIERIRPAARGRLELLGSKSWGSDPYAAGAWAYFRPGQIRRFARVMGRPHGRIHFCGEHLALSCRGMEGAMESGERAADEILASD